jgi:hypothetical protein
VFLVIAYSANLLLIRRNKTAKNQEQTNAKKQNAEKNEVKKECKKRTKERMVEEKINKTISYRMLESDHFPPPPPKMM